VSTRVTGPTAAIAWIRAGIQARGIYTGYRQLVVRFAAEAETAMLYNGSMLLRNIERTIAQSVVGSVSIAGHDPLASAALLGEAFQGNAPGVPVVVDCDGQRPDAIAALSRSVAVVQVALSGTEAASVSDTALESLKIAAREGMSPALAVVMTDRTTDVQVLRLLEQVVDAASGTKIVVHPATPSGPAGPDIRYSALMEAATAITRDVRFLSRLSAPIALY
jgi:hypothetical protein